MQCLVLVSLLLLVSLRNKLSQLYYLARGTIMTPIFLVS